MHFCLGINKKVLITFGLTFIEQHVFFACLSFLLRNGFCFEVHLMLKFFFLFFLSLKWQHEMCCFYLNERFTGPKGDFDWDFVSLNMLNVVFSFHSQRGKIYNSWNFPGSRKSISCSILNGTLALLKMSL